MENKNISAAQSFKLWLNAVYAKQPEEITNAMFAEYTLLDKAERTNVLSPVKIETQRSANGRAFRVAVYANGTTSDLS
jgi:hypothetical protein